MYNVMFAKPPLMIEKYPGFEDFDSYLNNDVKFRDPVSEDKFRTAPNQPSIDCYALNDPIFHNLNKFIKQSVKLYCKDILLTNSNLRVTQSWINKNVTGSQHTIHYHANSILSGIFYFTENATPTTFYSGEIDQINLPIINGRSNEFTAAVHFFTPMKGDLVIFPSKIQHLVSTNTNDETRYTLSFNTFATASLGKHEMMTYVEF